MLHFLGEIVKVELQEGFVSEVGTIKKSQDLAESLETLISVQRGILTEMTELLEEYARFLQEEVKKYE